MRSISPIKNSGLNFVFIFVIYFSIWALANLPGLITPWWYTDDFSNGTNRLSQIVQDSLSKGRPIEAISLLSLHLDLGVNKNQGIINIALHILQGILHICCATASCAFLSKKQVNQFTSIISVFPFVLWPFNQETVLWRSALTIPIASSLSLIGIYHITNRKNNFWQAAIGVLAITLSMLSHQLGALLALFIIVLLIFTNDFPQETEKREEIFNTVSKVIVGYLIGGLLSIILVKSFNGARAGLASNLFDKASFLIEINHLFISGYFYPKWLSIIQMTVLVVFILCIAFLSWLKDGHGVFFFRFLILGLLFIIPWLSLLLISENWPSWRVMYLAPLIFTGLYLSIMHFTMDVFKYQILIQFAVTGMLLILLGGYARVSWINSAEYPRLFQMDLALLHRIEDDIAINQLSTQIYILNSSNVNKDWNPWKLRFMHGDSKLSAFIIPFASSGFVSSFSNLNTTSDPTVGEKCSVACNADIKENPFHLVIANSENMLCVCP